MRALTRREYCLRPPPGVTLLPLVHAPGLPFSPSATGSPRRTRARGEPLTRPVGRQQAAGVRVTGRLRTSTRTHSSRSNLASARESHGGSSLARGVHSASVAPWPYGRDRSQEAHHEI